MDSFDSIELESSQQGFPPNCGTFNVARGTIKKVNQPNPQIKLTNMLCYSFPFCYLQKIYNTLF